MRRSRGVDAATFHGALLVDKPGGVTSHDVVANVRRLARQRRCGHTGTLDPFATGLLVICLGKATRLARFLSGAAKSYLATVRFGFSTDTYDRTGEVSGTRSDSCPGTKELESALSGFRGIQEQHPPLFSAKRIEGKRSHRLARAGLEVKPAPAKVEVFELVLLDYEPPRARLSLSVSSGTYVRSLAHDLGVRLGCGAHLEELRRTRIGSFTVEEASTLDDLSALAFQGRLSERLLSPAALLRDLPRVDVATDAVNLLVHGRDVPQGPWAPPAAGPRGPLRVCDEQGDLVSVARVHEESGVLRPLIVLKTPPGRKAREA
ncbi:MAG TPA: tRNA pseudouridine(55) synthase TruB [Vicinamibacteria bacterium]